MPLRPLISNSYAIGSVSGSSSYVGGLIGVSNLGTVTNSYATGSVNGTYNYVGGLIGYNGGAFNGTYATGKVSGNGSVGDLVGSSSNLVSNSYWDITTTGQTTSSGGIGMQSAQMQQQANRPPLPTATSIPAEISPIPGSSITATPIRCCAHS